MSTIRDDGLNRKDVRHPKPNWYRQAIQKCFTQPEIEKLLKQLDPKDKLDILLKTLPKEVENKGETGITVTFKLNGVREQVAIPGQVVSAALNPHNDDNEDDE